MLTSLKLESVKPHPLRHDEPLRIRMWTSFNNVTPAYLRLPSNYNEHYPMIPVNVLDYDRALRDNDCCRHIELPPRHLIPNAVPQHQCVIESQNLMKWDDYAQKMQPILVKGHLYWIVPNLDITEAIIGRFDRTNTEKKFEFVMTDQYSKKGRVGKFVFVWLCGFCEFGFVVAWCSCF